MENRAATRRGSAAKARSGSAAEPRARKVKVEPVPPNLGVTLTTTLSAVLALIVAALVGQGAWALGYRWTAQEPYAYLKFGLAAIGVVAVFGYVVAYVGYLREIEAHRLYLHLADVTYDAAVARKRRFRVQRWHWLTPTAVRLKPGGLFNLDEARLRMLRETFARATKADERYVWAQEVPRSWRWWERNCVRIWVGSELVPEPVAVLSDQPGVSVEQRLAAALGPVIDPKTADVEIEVLDWHSGAVPRPRCFVVRYPTRLMYRASETRLAVADMTRALLPAVNDDWHLDWKPTEDCYVLVDRPDPLAGTVSLPSIEAYLHPEGVLIGRREDGQPWRQPVLGTHVLSVGASGSGKSSWVWSVVRALSSLIADGRCRLYVCDPKGGMEMTRLEPIVHRFAATSSECLQLLKDAVAEMDAQAARLQMLGLRVNSEPTVDNPLHVILVDEILALMATDAVKIGAELEKLLAKGRAVGVSVLGATQDARIDRLKQRPQFLVTVAFRQNDAKHVDLILGPGARAQGALCDRIPNSDAGKGIAYVAEDGEAEIVRVRGAYVSDDEIERVVAFVASARSVVLPQGSGAVPEPMWEDVPRPQSSHPTMREPELEPESGIDGGLTAGIVGSNVVQFRPRVVTPEPELGSVSAEKITAQDLREGMRVLVEGHDVPCTIVEIVPEDPEDLDTKFEITYRPDGEDEYYDTFSPRERFRYVDD